MAIALMLPWPVFLLTFSPQSADTIPVDFGTRLRVVTEATPKPLVGRLRANDSGRVVVVVTERLSAVSIPLNVVTDLSWSRGRAQRRATVIGAGVGLLVGAAAYSNAAKPGPGDDPFGFDGAFLKLLAFVIAPSVGAVVGSLSAPERWERVPMPSARYSSASAGLTLQLVPHETLRVTTRSARLAGRPYVATRDTLTLVTGGGAVPVPWADVTDLRVSGGRNRWLGALFGAAIGLVAGVIGETSSPTTGNATTAFAGVGIGGAVLGAVLLSPRRWDSLPLPAR